jgi:hypothetical protein
MYPSRTETPPQVKNVFLLAKQVYFIGFGYHNSNLQRLEIPPNPMHLNFHGTIKGVPKSKVERLQELWHIRSDFDFNTYRNKICFEDSECGEFVDHYL